MSEIYWPQKAQENARAIVEQAKLLGGLREWIYSHRAEMEAQLKRLQGPEQDFASFISSSPVEQAKLDAAKGLKQVRAQQKSGRALADILEALPQFIEDMARSNQVMDDQYDLLGSQFRSSEQQNAVEDIKPFVAWSVREQFDKAKFHSQTGEVADIELKAAFKEFERTLTLTENIANLMEGAKRFLKAQNLKASQNRAG